MQRVCHKSHKFFIISLLSHEFFCGLISYVGYVKWKMHKSTHRGFTANDMYYIRTMDGSTLTLNDNPGIRIESNFLSKEEQDRLRLE